jgi:hypothetical protein
MDGDTIVVPDENRILVVVEEEFTIRVPGEIRDIEVPGRCC